MPSFNYWFGEGRGKRRGNFTFVDLKAKRIIRCDQLYNRLVNSAPLLLFWAQTLESTTACFPERKLILVEENQEMMLHIGLWREHLLNEFWESIKLIKSFSSPFLKQPKDDWYLSLICNKPVIKSHCFICN